MKNNTRARRGIEEEYDVLIIGAGIGGLTASAYLAQAGHKVLVIDQHYVVGGNASLFRRRDYLFDVGVHYLGQCGPGGVVRRVLEGIAPGAVTFQEMDPDGYDEVHMPSGVFRFPKGIAHLVDRLHAHCPDDNKAIRRYERLLRDIERLNRVLLGERRWWKSAAEAFRVIRAARCTLHDFVSDASQTLRNILGAQSLDYALPPRDVCALMAGIVTHHYVSAGAFFPVGGGQAISDAMAAAVERAGGHILLRATAKEIVVESGMVSGVRIVHPHRGACMIRARTVISNADYKKTMLSLVPPITVSARRRRVIASSRMAYPLGVLFLGVRDFSPPHPAANQWFLPQGSQQAHYDSVARGEHARDPFLFVSSASSKDPATRVAPSGITNMQVATVVPSSPIAWGLPSERDHGRSYRSVPAYEDAKQMFQESIVRALDRAIPGIASRIEYAEVATPFTHARFTSSTSGTAYGLAATPGQFMWRPRTQTHIKGLYLCGASCLPGHGIAGVMISGVLAAAAVGGQSISRRALAYR